MNRILFFSLLFFANVIFAQTTPVNGLEISTPEFYALQNATIIVSPGNILHNATIIIHKDKIEAVGKNIKVPKNAVVIDCEGKTILPAFIELNSNVGLPEVKRKSRGSRPQYETSKPGAYYWNESIHPEINAGELYSENSKRNKELINMGFGFVMTHQQDGIARGKGALVSLMKQKHGLMKSELTSFFSLKKGTSNQSYPSSQMGSIALLRQAFYDANWLKDNSETRNISLENLNLQRTGNIIFHTDDKFEIVRASKIAKEFDLSFNYIGSGNEYQIVDELSSLNSTIILPLNFPKSYNVSNPYISRQIPLSDLKHWEMAPMNPVILTQHGVNICFSSMNAKNAKEFWGNLRSAIQHGLSMDDALNALTLEPAKLIGVNNTMGSLEKGKFASFIIYNKNPFLESAKILETWMLGKQDIQGFDTNSEIAGEYNLIIENKKLQISVKGNSDKYTGEITFSSSLEGITKDSTVNLKVINDKNDITLHFNINDGDWNGSVTLRGKTNTKFGVFEGDGFLPNGKWVKWTAIKTDKVNQDNDESVQYEVDTLNHSWLPNIAYGFDSLPKAENIVIRNATAWTNEEIGVVENATLVVENGKISYIGTGEFKIPSDAVIIDAKGKHLTCGIIDEHSHIAISKGVNEGGQAISAEVSIEHVIDPDDIDIYRQLAGGVTTSQLLHGSANPIGGQSALIKLKWGHSADEMLVDDAAKFIKFALGENVKQSNWGSQNSIRFPQTRMGVEQLYFDGFQRAKAYTKEWVAYTKNSKLNKPRVDLELQVLSEILQSNRFVTCHSYVQSEINMLMHVADTMGFKINTFTHILEGYKLADKMVEHGVGGSTFSDWWAYKYEVNDAIPYNAALMAEQGVIVAINSDDAEMGRRLNQEAAKGVKYGGMSEVEAWKMVTLNPAKLLHMEERIGSLKAGKDADIVIWSDNPLSINAQVESTFIEGKLLYSKENDILLKERNNKEKARIISKMLADKTPTDEKRTFIKAKKGHFHCNTIGEKASTEQNHH